MESNEARLCDDANNQVCAADIYPARSARITVLFAVRGSTDFLVFIFGQTMRPGLVSVSMAALSYPTPVGGTGAGRVHGMVRVGTIIGLFFFLLLAKTGLSSLMATLALVPATGLLLIAVIRGRR